MRYRQIHLDFHTSEAIECIGKDFDKKEFQKILLDAHVDSITIFSKCHHGWAYHPSTANVMHPHLDFDLLAAQIEAAHEVGIRTPVYISAGFDERIAREHPEYILRKEDDTPSGPAFSKAGYHHLCMNSPYLEILAAQVEEVCKNYDADGIFLDIVNPVRCYCHNCRRTLIAEGKNPYDKATAKELAERVYSNYTRRMREAVDKYKPGLPIFHNGGNIPHGRRDIIEMNSHVEIEALPTGGWGYDYMPIVARYVQPIGYDFLAMTGKFHKGWGEFGGYKHPDALRYEAFLGAAHGGCCSIGDQLHPRGALDKETYRIIGEVYSELEAKEPWLFGARPVSDIAVYSAEAWYNEHVGCDVDMKSAQTTDKGISRIMRECHYLYDFIDAQSDISKYKLLILPDVVAVDASLEEKLRRFTENGGKILATGLSGLKYNNEEKIRENEFCFDLGARFTGVREISPAYMMPNEDSGIGQAAYVMYAESYHAELEGRLLGEIYEPYFKRSIEHFCSHRHAPCDPDKRATGATLGADGAYAAVKLFYEYGETGSLFPKKMAQYLIDECVKNVRTVETTLPPIGEITLAEQAEEKRYVLHMIYAPRSVKGSGKIEVIESCEPYHNAEFTVRTADRRIKRVYMAPENKEIPFEYISDGVLKLTVPEFRVHGMLVLEY